MSRHLFHFKLRSGVLFVVMWAWIAMSSHAETAVGIQLPDATHPYGISALWDQGDFVSKGTLLILLLMSMGTWYVIFGKLWEQTQVLAQAKEVQGDFWKIGSVRKAAESLSAGSVFRRITETGIACSEPAAGLMEAVDLQTAITMGIQRAVSQAQSRLQSGLALLATVGSTAPFVGLFGTVWGIYHALVKIGLSGQASIDKVAGPVGEALIMTALGLAVAVPAVLFYNWLVRRNKTIVEQIQTFGSDIHAVLLANAKNS